MGIIREIFRKIKSRSLGAMGQYNAAFVPVLADGECVILQTDNVGNLRVTGGPGAVFVVGGPGAQDTSIDDINWFPVEISYESNAYVKGTNFGATDGNVPVSADGDVVRPRASRYGVQFVQLVGQNGSDTVQWYSGQVYVASEGYGIPPMAVRKDVPVALEPNNTWSPLELNADGGLWIAQTPGADRSVTGSVSVAQAAGSVEINTQNCGTVHVNTIGSAGTAVTYIEGLLPDGATWVQVPAYTSTFPVLISSPVGGFTTDIDMVVSCAGYSKIRVRAAGVNLATIFLYLRATVITNDRAELISKYFEDAGHTNADPGTFMLAVRNDLAATSTTATNRDYSALSVDEFGQLFVRFSPAAGGPVYSEDSAANDANLGFSTLRVRRDAPGTSSAGSDGDWCWPLQSSTGYDLVRAESFDTASAADRGFEVAPLWSHYFPVVTLVSALTIPATSVGVDGAGNPVWTGGDVGPEIPTMGMTRLSVWIDLDINEMTGVRFRALGKHTSADADEYELPIIKPNTAATPYSLTIDGEYITFAQNIDQKKVITWDVSNSIAYVQIQCGATADPGVNAILNTVKYTLGFGA